MNEDVIDILESMANEITVYLWVQRNGPEDIKARSITLLEDICEKAQSLALDHCVRPDQPPS